MRFYNIAVSNPKDVEVSTRDSEKAIVDDPTGRSIKIPNKEARLCVTSNDGNKGRGRRNENRRNKDMGSNRGADNKTGKNKIEGKHTLRNRVDFQEEVQLAHTHFRYS